MKPPFARLAVGLIAATACTSASQRDPGANPAPTVTEGASNSFAEVLLQPDEALDGVLFDPTVSGPVPSAALEGELAGEGEAWPPPGFMGAFQNVFRMPASEDPASLPPGDVRGVVNLGIQFEDPESASAFLDRSFPPEFVLEEAREHGYDSLGDERRGLRTDASTDRPVRTTLIWRRGRNYFQLNVFGDYPVPEIMERAKAVDARAGGVSA